jgi:hypothetical protein
MVGRSVQCLQTPEFKRIKINERINANTTWELSPVNRFTFEWPSDRVLANQDEWIL